jgi:PPP family 3-phenylpropionic acid transporter
MIEVFYFFYYQAIAIYMAFLPAYLRGLGLSGRQLSSIYVIPPLLALVIPLGWAWLADRTRQHARVLRIAIGGAWLGLTPLLFAQRAGADARFRLIFAGWLGYALFSIAVGGLADALAVARVRGGAIYGRMRLWGSVGYVCSSLLVGALLWRRAGGGRGADPAAPVALWLALACATAAALPLRGSGEAGGRPHFADLRALLGNRHLGLVLLASTLHWICLVPYNVYFGVLLRDLGLPALAAGLGYAIGVVAEVIVLMHFHRVQTRYRLDTLMAAAFAASAVRWLATSAARAPALLIALQLLHGMTFGMFWSAAIATIAAAVPGPLRATGQALLVIAINLGSAIGNAFAGRIYDAAGARPLFLIAAFGELAPLVVLLGARRLRG